MNIERDGYLELILGPMFSGKSSELIKRYRLYKCLNKEILFINHVSNTRYNNNDLKSIITHDNIKINNCISVNILDTINIEYKSLLDKTDVILIEELQFFKDAYEVIKYWVDVLKKTIICAGLDGDYTRSTFGEIYKLYPLCDKIEKISALCKKCGDGTNAPFTNRLTKNYTQTLVGGDDIYEAVCRKHYLESRLQE